MDPARIRLRFGGPGAREILSDVDGSRWSVMRARSDEETGPHGPAAAYDLAGLASAYEAFIARYADLRVAVRNTAGSTPARSP
ncbi:hypothetical protein [Streptosporangium sp. NPDC023615]|uniref:hypothetical protein n=1 Tax=Streptosporangium sp. NPDC023615 TaxID=3154794 RepID=UPI00341229E4